MHDVEHHTVCYLRDLLVTPLHRDPTITTFLSIWAYEEHWHGEALGEVLKAHGEPGNEDRVTALRSALGSRTGSDRSCLRSSPPCFLVLLPYISRGAP